jgi:hypothetical protein
MGFTLHINCVYFEDFGRCSNKNVKKSLFGIGPRYCSETERPFHLKCPYMKEHPRPISPPVRPPKRIISEDI